MAIVPHITFKAGICDVDENESNESHVVPRPTPGYIYLYTGEDELLRFCWRPRSAPVGEADLELLMFPADGSFKPYQKHGSKYKPSNEADTSKPVTNGRLFVLRFTSSSIRHVFWLQSRSQDPSGDPSYFSPRDLKLGEIVNGLLKGETINVRQELSNISNDQGGPGGDDDTAMEDADGGPDADQNRAASGGAGPGATGGDIREEGEEAREGGADGGRAAAISSAEAQAAVANFLKSLQGNQNLGGPGSSSEGKLFTTLSDLLQPQNTLPVLETSDDSYLDHLLSLLPPAIIMLAASSDEESSMDPDPETVQAVAMSLDIDQKREILRKVLHSPQFSQSLGSLTMALRDGGLPTISEALKIKVENGGYLKGGGVPVGGGDAVEAFVNGVKSEIEENEKENDNRMET